MISSKTSDAFLALTRLGIGHDSSCFAGEVDWLAVKALAERHGLSSIIMDGIEKFDDMLSKEFSEKEERRFLRRAIIKYRR